MPKENLNEREFELVNILGAQLSANQRDLSHHMDLSLGTINMLIRRLMVKGYIRIEQLDKRKVQYILTPKGFTEKMRKSIKYTLKTINSIGAIRNRLKTIIHRLHGEGERRFFILGDSDLVILVETIFKDNHLGDCMVQRLSAIPLQKIDGIILICTENTQNGSSSPNRRIDLIRELAKDNGFPARNEK